MTNPATQIYLISRFDQTVFLYQIYPYALSAPSLVVWLLGICPSTIPLDIDKASNIFNPLPFIIKKQEIISMQISFLKLLIISVIHKLESALDISGLLYLKSLAFEIYTPKDLLAKLLLAKGSQHNVLNK